jgi:hypothetical protein
MWGPSGVNSAFRRENRYGKRQPATDVAWHVAVSARASHGVSRAAFCQRAVTPQAPRHEREDSTSERQSVDGRQRPHVSQNRANMGTFMAQHQMWATCRKSHRNQDQAALPLAILNTLEVSRK